MLHAHACVRACVRAAVVGVHDRVGQNLRLALNRRLVKPCRSERAHATRHRDGARQGCQRTVHARWRGQPTARRGWQRTRTRSQRARFTTLRRRSAPPSWRRWPTSAASPARSSARTCLRAQRRRRGGAVWWRRRHIAAPCAKQRHTCARQRHTAAEAAARTGDEDLLGGHVGREAGDALRLLQDARDGVLAAVARHPHKVLVRLRARAGCAARQGRAGRRRPTLGAAAMAAVVVLCPHETQRQSVHRLPPAQAQGSRGVGGALCSLQRPRRAHTPQPWWVARARGACGCALRRRCGRAG